MPVSGFRRGDKIITPSGRRGTVSSTGRIRGREKVYVRLEDSYGEERSYYASSLKLIQRENG